MAVEIGIERHTPIPGSLIFLEDVQQSWHIDIELIPKIQIIGFVLLHIPPEIITIEISKLLSKDNHITRKLIHLEILKGAKLVQKCLTFDIQTAPTFIAAVQMLNAVSRQFVDDCPSKLC